MVSPALVAADMAEEFPVQALNPRAVIMTAGKVEAHRPAAPRAPVAIAMAKLCHLLLLSLGAGPGEGVENHGALDTALPSPKDYNARNS